ncbi:uncharacterized protein LOC134934533 [Pseudophryne corroboree]|uniref:uncharacterized protein LOC134934533 n=1 Tax=Pseudophryne corroboree TaxID=495146 RepID=UPI003081D450
MPSGGSNRRVPPARQSSGDDAALQGHAEPPGAFAAALATVVAALGPLAAAPELEGGSREAADAAGAGAFSAAQRVARACRELGAAAAQLHLQPRRDESLQSPRTPALGRAGRTPSLLSGSPPPFLPTDVQADARVSESEDEDVTYVATEESGSDQSTASGEAEQLGSVSSTPSGSRSSSPSSSSSSASSSSLSSAKSDVSSATKAKKRAIKYAKKAAGQQERRKRRRRLSKESRKARKRCEYTAVMRGLRDSCSKSIRRGDYVDVFVLTKDAKKEFKAATAKKGIGAEAFRTFDNWLAGFWVFAACYLEDRPDEHMNVIRYLHLVHDMQRTSAGDEWRRYDVEFREKQDGLHVMDFGFKDVEVWLKVTRASQQAKEPRSAGADGHRAGPSAHAPGADGRSAKPALALSPNSLFLCISTDVSADGTSNTLLYNVYLKQNYNVTSAPKNEEMLKRDVQPNGKQHPTTDDIYDEVTEMHRLFNKLEHLCMTETKQWWDQISKQKYLDDNLIPRGLRILKESTFKADKDFTEEWNNILDNCSKNLIKVLIKYREQRVNELQLEIEKVHTLLKVYEKSEEYKARDLKVNKKLEEFEQSLITRKENKMERDVSDYQSGNIHNYNKRNKLREQEYQTPYSKPPGYK